MSAKILVTIDGTEKNKIAIEKAIAMAVKDGSELSAVTVYNTMSKDLPVIGESNIKSDSVKSYCRKMFVYIKEAAARQGLQVNTIMAQGIPADVIIGMSKDYNVVICGKTGKKVHKSVSNQVIKGAKCDVKVVY